MKNMKLIHTVFLCAFTLITLTGCGDANPASTGLALSLARKYNSSLKDRAPHVVAEQFFAAFYNADFQEAEKYCDESAAVFMQVCRANQNLQDQKEKKFWNKEFVYKAGLHSDCVTLQDVRLEDVTEGNKNVSYATLTYVHPAYNDITMNDAKPQVIDIAMAIFPKELTAPAEDKNAHLEECGKLLKHITVPEAKVDLLLKKNEAGEWKIINILLQEAAPDGDGKPAGDKDSAEETDYDKAFMDLAAEAEAKEKEKKQAEQPKEGAGSGDTQGGANIDFGF